MAIYQKKEILSPSLACCLTLDSMYVLYIAYTGSRLWLLSVLKDSGSVVVDSSKIYCCPHCLWGILCCSYLAVQYLECPFLVLPSSRAGCFTFTVYLMSCDCWYPVP